MAKPSSAKQVSIELPRPDSAEYSSVPGMSSSTLSPCSMNLGLDGKLEELEKKSMRLHTPSSYYTESPYPRSLEDTGVKDSISKRKVLHQKMNAFHSALGEEIQLSEITQIENLRLLQENSNLSREVQELQAVVDELERSKKDLQTRNVELGIKINQLSTALTEADRHSSQRHRGMDEAALIQYSDFISNKLEDVPELNLLFKGRVADVSEFREHLSSGNYSGLLLKTLQILSDLLVYFSRKQGGLSRNWSSPRIFTPVQSESPGKMEATQTLPEVSSPDRASHHTQSPSFNLAQKSLFQPDTSLHNSSFDPRSKVYLSTDASSDAQQYATGLNERLAKLNQQIYDTMASSKRLLSNPSKTDLLHSLRSAVSSPTSGLQSSPSVNEKYGDESVALTEKIRKAEMSMKDESIPEDENLLQPTEETQGRVEKERLRSPNRWTNRPLKNKQPQGKKGGVGNKTDVCYRQERMLPVMWKSDGWNSVGEFFGGNADLEKKKKKEGEQAEGQ